ncbi:hypothetical protein [Streptomyces sp. NPDC056190]|uniref:hypothetical protein n=1 Tax=Streptomyces sp. NPDC056190 TaxID=3345741 RepID=UPI0035E2CB65
MTLANLRPGQSIAVVMQHIQRDNAAGPTWRLPVKNNSASAVGPLTPLPRPLVWALDEYLPVRTHKAPHSTQTEGPLLVSRTGRGLDRVTFTRLLRDVAAPPRRKARRAERRPPPEHPGLPGPPG